MTDWVRSYSKTYQDIKRENVWKLWTDINNWSKFHSDLDYSKLEGAFTKGNHFILKPKGARPVKIEITEVETGHKFTDCTHFPGAKMFDHHEMQEVSDGLRIINTITVTGPLKWIWIKLVARKVANSIPEQMEALAHAARKLQS